MYYITVVYVTFLILQKKEIDKMNVELTKLKARAGNNESIQSIVIGRSLLTCKIVYVLDASPPPVVLLPI